MQKFWDSYKRYNGPFIFSIVTTLYMVLHTLRILLLSNSAFYNFVLLFYIILFVERIIRQVMITRKYPDFKIAEVTAAVITLETILMPLILVFGMDGKETFTNFFNVYIYLFAAYGIYRIINALAKNHRHKGEDSYKTVTAQLDMTCALYTVYVLTLTILQLFARENYEVLLGLFYAFSGFEELIAIVIVARSYRATKIIRDSIVIKGKDNRFF